MKLFRELPVTTESEVKFECSKKNVKPLQVAREFSGRGLFYYDSDDHSKSARNICVLQKYYTLCSIPKTPIKFSELSLQMQKLLEDSILDVDDFGKSKMIDIKCDVDKEEV